MGFFKFGKRKQKNTQTTVPVNPVPVTPVPVTPVPPVVPVPLPTVPPVEPKYVYDDRNLLVKPAPKMVRNFRADPIVDADCPTAVKVPSGHYVSVPRPDLGETFMGYAMRVVFQVGKDEVALNGIGAMFLGTDGCFKPYGGFKEDGSNWPQAADAWFNGVPMTEAEKVKAEEERLRAEKQWEEHWAAKEKARQEAAANPEPTGKRRPVKPTPVEPTPVQPTPTEPAIPAIPAVPTTNTVDGEVEIEIVKE